MLVAVVPGIDQVNGVGNARLLFRVCDSRDRVFMNGSKGRVSVARMGLSLRSYYLN